LLSWEVEGGAVNVSSTDFVSEIDIRGTVPLETNVEGWSSVIYEDRVQEDNERSSVREWPMTESESFGLESFHTWLMEYFLDKILFTC
jgi:hypothetical protein